MIKIVAKYTVKTEMIDQFKSYVEKLVAETKKEEGCISYQLCQDINGGKVLTFIEEWNDREALSNHMKSKHFLEIAPMLDQMKEKDVEFNIYSIVI